jgi:uncharacterized membrane protein YfcA
MLTAELLQLLFNNPAQLFLACFIAFSVSILGGLAGYGTGLILPVFLVPIVGVGNVIPVMAVAMFFNNASRVGVFRNDIQWPHVGRILLLGLPACLVGAYSYTLLNARWIALLLGIFLLLSVPLRRLFNRAQVQLSNGTELGVGTCFGFVNGILPGAGVFLISILLHAGLTGSAVVATDAVVSVVMGFSKVVLFSSLAALDLRLGLTGLLIGVCTIPGAFIARALIRRMSVGIHVWIMELAVIIGAVTLLWRAV